jgi:hypothetical protein
MNIGIIRAEAIAGLRGGSVAKRCRRDCACAGMAAGLWLANEVI